MMSSGRKDVLGRSRFGTWSQTSDPLGRKKIVRQSSSYVTFRVAFISWIKCLYVTYIQTPITGSETWRIIQLTDSVAHIYLSSGI